MITTIFFDFDGVLCESVAVKTEAFRKLYEPYGLDVANAVVAYHQAHGGVSRFDKIRYFHKTLLHIDISDDELGKWANHFSDLAMNGVVAADEVPGATQFLETYGPEYICYVITATPTEEMNTILQQKGWSKYFKGIFGSPDKKDHWVKHIMHEQHLDAANAVFIGDALADKNAADEAGIKFILRRTADNKKLFANYNGLSINDITDLYSILRAL